MTQQPSGILLPYQKRWVEDRSRFKIWLAARQIGKSFGSTLELRSYWAFST